MAFTMLHNGTLIDGNGGKPLPHAAVLIKDNQIQAVGRKADIPLPDAEITYVDAQGGFILPGLIDTHVHLMYGDFNLLKTAMTPFSYNFYSAMANMKNTVMAGITSVRDAGGADAGVKQAVEHGLILGPRMQISISILTITGGHGDGWMPSGVTFDLVDAYPGRPNGRCDGPDEVRKKVREILRAGADVIKVCSTGGVLSPTDHPEFTQFTIEELEIMVQEAAYRRGIKVMAHAQGAEGIKNAVRAGIHSIEHGIFLDDEAIELMLAHGTYLVPTLLAPLAVVEIAETQGTMPEWGVRKARETIEIHSENIAKAYKAGVRVAMGTDAGVMPHGTNLRELGLMCQIGMSPMEALVATTKVAAACMGWEERVGTITPGKLADVIVTKSDPLADIRSLERVENIVVVVKDGRIVKDERALAG
ncbi:MAG: amidohydrolase family protein [Ardenticatenaceae bacterium]|nr:amidohydrolase family protein [Ardenticatenaceae bacterium]